MKFGYSIPTLLCVAGSAIAETRVCGSAGSGCVFTYDPSNPDHVSGASNKVDKLEPQTARLVLAQRAGAEDFHFSGNFDQKEIEAVNQYGIQRTLFSSTQEIPQIMLFYEAREEDDSALNLPAFTGFFSISPAPAAYDLFEDFKKQSKALFTKVNTLEELVSEFESFATTGKYHLTALITPKVSGIESAAWGTYEMPGAQSPLKKAKRQAMKEEPLSELPEETASSAGAIQSTSTHVSSLAEEGDPLPGIMPSCFRSQSSCETSTRNCSQHGSCYRKYADQDVDTEGAKPECWTCMCRESKSEDGKSTTYWGGSACQKKDVSIPFWIITAFTVGLIFMISFAVGTIWSMGQEELPSVIGAGVSGPPRR